MTDARCAGLALTLLLAMVLGGCAAIPPIRPQAPEVSLAGIRPVSLGLTRQQLAVQLRVSNPNRFDLPLDALRFTASLAGEELARGASTGMVVIPAQDSALLEVLVDTGLTQMLGPLRRLLRGEDQALDYRIRGSLDLGNWPRPIPFDNRGELENPLTGDAPAARG